jgi:DnaJ domain
MKNFYDLLGARPDDDAETLRKAYRKAVKASHPDHHGGDPDVAAQFRQIVETYNILRDAEQRAAYNRFLEFQRKPLRAKLKRVISELKHHILYDTVAAVVFTIAVAGGYTLFVRISETPVHEAARTTGDKQEGMVAVQAPHRNDAERDSLGRVAAPLIPILPRAAASAANDPDALETKKDEPVPRQAGQTIDVARDEDHSGVAIDQPSATAGEGDLGKRQRIQSFDRHEALPADVEFSVPGRHDFGPNASSSSGDKLGNKASEPGDRNTGDLALAANDPDALEMTKGEPVPRQAGQTIDVARHDDHPGVAIDQPSATAGEGDPGKSQRVQSFNQHEAPSADVEFSVPGRHDFGPNASSSVSDKLGNKASEPGDRKTGDLALAANDPDALEMTKGEPVPRQAGQTIDVARHNDHPGVAIDQASATAGEGDPGKSQRVQSFDRHEALSADVEFSVPGRHDFGPNASSSVSDKLGNKASEPGGGNTGDPASAANDPDALEMTKDEPVPRQAGQTIDIARHDDHPGIAIDQPGATTGEDDPGKSQRVHPFDRHEALSAAVEFSVPGRHDVAPNAFSSGGDKLGNKSSEPGGRNRGELRVPKKISARPLPAVKRRAASRPPFKQALLQQRYTSACAGSRSCSGGVAPLFGVGP